MKMVLISFCQIWEIFRKPIYFCNIHASVCLWQLDLKADTYNSTHPDWMLPQEKENKEKGRKQEKLFKQNSKDHEQNAVREYEKQGGETVSFSEKLSNGARIKWQNKKSISHTAPIG